MLDVPKTKREFYESQDKEQLIIFLLNSKYENERLQEKLKMLTGCKCYGDCDGMDGSCVDCYYDNPQLQMKCSQFQDTFRRIEKLKPAPTEVITLFYNLDDMDLKVVADMVQILSNKFQSNTVIALPDRTSLKSCSKDVLKNIISAISEVIETM